MNQSRLLAAWVSRALNQAKHFRRRQSAIFHAKKSALDRERWPAYKCLRPYFYHRVHLINQHIERRHRHPEAVESAACEERRARHPNPAPVFAKPLIFATQQVKTL